MEQFDVVIVGARLAGCSLAAPLARAGHFFRSRGVNFLL